MGVHTGEAEERDGDYFGPAVNRAARLMSEGRSGQVLVSLSAAETVRDQLGDGMALVELGERALRFLSRPERVCELTWTDPVPPTSTAAGSAMTLRRSSCRSFQLDGCVRPRRDRVDAVAPAVVR